MRKIIYLMISLFLTFTLFSQDKTSDVMKTQDKTSDVMKAQDKTSDVIKAQIIKSNEMKNKITGSIKKEPGGWVISLKYNDEKIEGDFNRLAAVNLPVNTYPFTLAINKIKYRGNISQKIPVFQSNYYDIDISSNNKTGFKGTIKRTYQKTFRKDMFEIDFSDKDNEKDLAGFIEYTKKKNDKILSFKLDDQDITGTMAQKSVYLSDYSLRFGDKRIIGTIDNKRPEYIFNFQTADLTNDQIFMFLFFEVYLLIDSAGNEAPYSPNVDSLTTDSYD